MARELSGEGINESPAGFDSEGSSESNAMQAWRLDVAGGSEGTELEDWRCSKLSIAKSR